MSIQPQKKSQKGSQTLRKSEKIAKYIKSHPSVFENEDKTISTLDLKSKNSFTNEQKKDLSKTQMIFEKKDSTKKFEVNNSLRLSYEVVVLNQLLKRENNQKKNREKVIANSYGSTYENFFVNHCRKLDEKNGFKTAKKQNSVKTLSPNFIKNKTFLVTPRSFQKIDILKIRKRMKVSENIFNVKSIKIPQKNIPFSLPQSECSKKAQHDCNLARLSPANNLVYKIKKSNHNASNSLHQPEKSKGIEEEELRCETIKLIEMKKENQNLCSNKEQKKFVEQAKNMRRPLKKKFFDEKLESLVDIKKKKLLDKIFIYEAYLNKQRTNVNYSPTYQPGDKNCYRGYIGNGNNSSLIKELFRRRWWWNLTKQKNSADFIWTQLRNKMLSKYCQNHIQNNDEIGNKKSLFLNMRNYCKIENLDLLTLLPLTFHITELGDAEYASLSQYCKKIEVQHEQTLWIIKPGENSNRGNGISIVVSQNVENKIQEFFHQNDQKLKPKKHQQRTLIIQKYIKKPLLYQNRKFDIRCYVLVTKIGQNMSCYWGKQGYIRTSSLQYDAKNCTDQNIHLTNDAVQMRSLNYGKFQQANKLSYEAFEEYVKKISSGTISFLGDLVPQFKEIARISLESCFGQTVRGSKLCVPTFELLGFDFMIDDAYHPYLIQVNTNPCLETPCKILKKLIPHLLNDTLKMTVDVIFPPPAIENWPQNKYYLAEDAPNFFEPFDSLSFQRKEKNMQNYSLLGNESIEREAIQVLKQESSREKII